MHILGIYGYHGGAFACLSCNALLFAEEERFNYVKYQAGFPTEALRCLQVCCQRFRLDATIWQSRRDSEPQGR